MEQVQIGNKTLNLLELDELNEDSQEKENKRIFVSKFISNFLCFSNNFYPYSQIQFFKYNSQGGHSDHSRYYISDYDILVKDKDATNFKIDSSLSKLGIFLDYEPLAYQRLIEKINTAFDDFSKRNQELLDQRSFFAEEKLKLTQGYVENTVALGFAKKQNKIIKKCIASLKLNAENNKHYSFWKLNSLKILLLALLFKISLEERRKI